MQRKVAVAAIGPSALRGRPPGAMKAAQDFCAKLSLRRLSVASEIEFNRRLAYCTAKLQADVRRFRKDWGGARKSLNLFLRDAVNNRFLFERFQLERIEPWMEIPLDRLVADKLIEHDKSLRRWPWKNIKSLTPEASGAYQESARRWAKKLGWHRVHLDMKLWTEARAT
jgi:hypothetical protein